MCQRVQKTNEIFPSFLFVFPAGFIENCVEQLKQSHSQLNLESVRPHKAPHRKKVRSRNSREHFCHSKTDSNIKGLVKYYVFCFPQPLAYFIFKQFLCLAALSGRKLYERSQADSGDAAERSLLQRWMQSEPPWTPFNSSANCSVMKPQNINVSANEIHFNVFFILACICLSLVVISD